MRKQKTAFYSGTFFQESVDLGFFLNKRLFADLSEVKQYMKDFEVLDFCNKLNSPASALFSSATSRREEKSGKFNLLQKLCPSKSFINYFPSRQS